MKRKKQPEYELQATVCDFLRLRRILFVCDLSSAYRLSIPQQVRAKRLRHSTFRCPDIMILEPRGTHYGMFLELKATSPYKRDGTLRTDSHLTEQYQSMQLLRSRGYYAMFSWEFEMAVMDIDWYLGL